MRLLVAGIGAAGAALNESPSEKEGKYPYFLVRGSCCVSLNESPSEKEGKSRLTCVAPVLMVVPQ